MALGPFPFRRREDRTTLASLWSLEIQDCPNFSINALKEFVEFRIFIQGHGCSGDLVGQLNFNQGAQAEPEKMLEPRTSGHQTKRRRTTPDAISDQAQNSSTSKLTIILFQVNFGLMMETLFFNLNRM